MGVQSDWGAWRVLRLYALLWFAPRHAARDFPQGGGMPVWLGPPLLGLGFSWLAIELYSLLAQALPILYGQLLEMMPALRYYGIALTAREPSSTLGLMLLEFLIAFHLFAFCYSRAVRLVGGSLDGVDSQRAVLWALWLLVPPLLLGGGTVYFTMLRPLALGLEPTASGSVLVLLLLSLASLSWSSLAGCILIAERSAVSLVKAALLLLLVSLVVSLLMWPLRFWRWA